MKKKIRRRRCKNCHDLYLPDPRHLKRQKFCDKPECKKAGKNYSQQKWLKKAINRDHFSGSENVIRVQQWREQNPGYWRRKNPSKKNSLFEDALQDTISAKRLDDKVFQLDLTQDALQDLLSAKTLAVIVFGTQVNKTALQDIIDTSDQKTIPLTPNILKKLMDKNRRCQNGQTFFFPGTL